MLTIISNAHRLPTPFPYPSLPRGTPCGGMNETCNGQCECDEIPQRRLLPDNQFGFGTHIRVNLNSKDEQLDDSNEGQNVVDSSEGLEGIEVCDRVHLPRRTVYADEEIKACKAYESAPLIIPDCSKREEVVPRMIYSVSKDSQKSYHRTATCLGNPNYQCNHHSDESALEYVRSKCGEVAAMAYSCFVPPAYRADIFRFCAMYADGGVYLDEVSIIL